MSSAVKYTNSPLAIVTILSPWCTKPRTNKIDTITIHVMDGDISVESCGNWFADPTSRVSSNYGIDSKGRIALYVDEANGTWCSSSQANDNRAITIEVANYKGAPDYPVTDAAFTSLINLCADICKRNNIKQLIWNPDKSNPGNMTVHRWFQPGKACPGNYLFNKHGEIANEVNKLIGVATTSNVVTSNTSAMPMTTVRESPNEQPIVNFLTKEGFNVFAVCGIMGNFYDESGLSPINLQNNFEKKLGFTDRTYTDSVDNGSYTNFVNDEAGYGLAQWTFWTFKRDLLEYARRTNRSIGDLGMQLEFFLNTLKSGEFAKVKEKLTNVTSIREASDIVLIEYERPLDQSESVKLKRAGFGQHYYIKYFKNKTSETKNEIKEDNQEFTIRTTVPELNIRKGPGINFDKLNQQITDNGKLRYTIVEVKDGPIDTKWGRLKSGVGWIDLQHTIRV